ncbi:30S ribosomal protein S14 [Candidatus Woesearchaeota archaeon]|nr:30S ribosomal protein S14 [Candidatus Woesearchaeota archaeon]
MLKQIGGKPGKLAKYNKHNVPRKRKFGKELKKCRRCGSASAPNAMFGLRYCRQCLREVAQKIGFKKFN